MIAENKKHLLFILIVLFSFTAIMLFAYQFNIFQGGDNCGYMSLGIAFANGNGFTNPALPGLHHFLWWPPGFPLFIALFVKIIGPHWYVLKLLIFLGLYVSFTLYAVMLYKEEQNFTKAALILTALCFSSGIHLLSSYLYSETFFITSTLFFFFLWNTWQRKLTFQKVIILSVFAIYISTIRLIGICLPVALIIYILFFNRNEEGNRWYCIIPLILVITYISLSLFVPSLKVGAFRATLGLHPQFRSVITGTYSGETVTGIRFLEGYLGKTFHFFRGYGLTLIPQAVIRSSYDLYTMNKLKAIIMALVTGFVLIGGVSSFRKIKLIHLYVVLYMGVLFIYGPKYVRLVVPIIPFLFWYLYSGFEVIIRLCVKNNRIAVTALSVIWTGVIFDNAFLTFTDTHRTMPAQFGDSQFQESLKWVEDNVKSEDVIVCQINSYLYLQRGPYCLPYNYARTVNEFMAYLDVHSVDYVVVSPFYRRPHYTFMDRTGEAEALYPDNFIKVFGREGDESYILKYIHVN